MQQCLKNKIIQTQANIGYQMDKQKMQSKLKSLSQKNKKLLQSISTHLINNPDQLQSKLHEHRYLQQKYNQLIGFSRQNVQNNEKIQAMLLVKQEEIKRLNKIIAELKDNNGSKLDSMEREYRRKRGRDQEEIQGLKQEIISLKRQLTDSKDIFMKQKNRLQSQLDHQKKQTQQKSAQLSKLSQKLSEQQDHQHQLQQQHQKQIEQYVKKIRTLQQQNTKIRKNNQIDSLNEIKANLSSFKNKNRNMNVNNMGRDDDADVHENGRDKRDRDKQRERERERERGRKIKETLQMD